MILTMTAKIDLAAPNYGNGTISILLGNGDGTFQPAKNYATASQPNLVVAGDFNGDGYLDLAITQYLSSAGSVMLGKGDGSFPSHVEYATGSSPFGIVAGDFNGDGKLDLATADYLGGPLSVLLGDGDGTFQFNMDFPDGGLRAGAIAAGDLDGDGSIDFVLTHRVTADISVILNKPVIALAPSTLLFSLQTLGTVSQPQAITVSSRGSAPLALQSINIVGTDPSDFSSTTSCPQTLLVGKSCAVNVTFDPQKKGTRQAYVDLKDNVPNLEQRVGLSGSASVVSLSPSRLSFGDETVGTTSAPQSIVVTNQGRTPLKISKVSITGTDHADFIIQ